ncbi:hypothetical protein BDR06DRAFT_493833 [Suillus hirtellus]|nr:hypothetical protein BDR06DRAFT_493833 [Suillus hirtellus]
MGPCQLRRELPYWYCVEMCCFLLKMIIFTSLNTYLHELRMQCSVFAQGPHNVIRIAKLPTSPNMQYLHCLVYQLSALNRTLRGSLRTKSLFFFQDHRDVSTYGGYLQQTGLDKRVPLYSRPSFVFISLI